VTGLAAGLALLASVAGPMAPSAAAFNLPPQLGPRVQSPLAGRQLQIRLPDLQADAVAVRSPESGSVSVGRGDVLGLIAMVRNTGAADAGESVARFDLVWEQTEGVPSSGDVAGGSLISTLGEQSIPAIDASSAYFPFIEGGAWYFTVPASTRSGIYRVRACADATEIVTESSNTNNCRLSDQRVAVS
jgi:hypothetical protein